MLANALLRGTGAADAVGLPRLHHQFLPNVLHAEDWQALDGSWEIVPPAVVDGLRARGHDVRRDNKHATTQLVLQEPDSGALHAVSYRRKSGRPAGY